MTDEKAIERLNGIKSTLIAGNGILETMMEILSVSEMADKELYNDVGVWLVKFCTSIGDLRIIKIHLEQKGYSEQADGLLMAILERITPLKTEQEQLVQRAIKVVRSTRE